MWDIRYICQSDLIKQIIDNIESMENFIFQNPTKLIFGKGMIGQLAKEIPAGKRILVTFGGGSVRKNGVYDQVKEALKGFEVTNFGGSRLTRRSRRCVRLSNWEKRKRWIIYWLSAVVR